VILRNASLQAKHLCLLAVAIAGAIPYGWLAVWSLALAGGIQVLNLAVTERSVRLLVAEHGSAQGARIVFMLRLLTVLAAICLAVAVFGAKPIPFVIGLALIVPAALWHGLSKPTKAS
jgi:hypothetical protein